MKKFLLKNIKNTKIDSEEKIASLSVKSLVFLCLSPSS